MINQTYCNTEINYPFLSQLGCHVFDEYFRSDFALQFWATLTTSCGSILNDIFLKRNTNYVVLIYNFKCKFQLHMN